MTGQIQVGGYVLAGGRSSRMGTDKALLQLGGKPLIEHAVAKLRGVCAAVHILSGNSALADYGSLVADIHPGCGPVGGIEAALTHSQHDWNLILPVDVPFLPMAILLSWAAAITAPGGTTRVAVFSVEGRAQPAVCLLHRDITPSIVAAVSLEEFKLLPVLEASAEVFAMQNNQTLEETLSIRPVVLNQDQGITPAQRVAQSLWFANLNTREEFAQAEGYAAALDG